jgi:Tol biopolymer transport system component
MNPRNLGIIPLLLVLAACRSGSAVPGSSRPPGVPSLASSPSTTAPSASQARVPVPPGRILFSRHTPDGVEHYFTIKTDGTDEHAVYDREGCECAHWSADGTHVLTLDATGHGTFSFTTYRPDGTERTVVKNPIGTLNLAPGASTADGRRIAFAGWDETKPANTGLYVASPDLTELRMVLPLQEGMRAIEPFGLSPDGSRIVFFAETGPSGGTTHAGDNYVVNSDGTGLRKLNPPGSKTGYIGVPTISLSPDGRQAAFDLDEAVYLVDLDGGEARRITSETGYVWAVSWSSTGAWITYTRIHGDTHTVSLVRPDGTGEREISGGDEADEAAASVWSPDGRYLLVQRDSDSSLDGPRDLWIMDLDGRYISQVTREPSDYATYGWAPAN